MKQKVLLTLCFTISLASCSKKESSVKDHDYDGGIINRLGIYRIQQSKLTLKVIEQPVGIVKYELSKDNGTVLISSVEHPSMYHRWGFYWEDSAQRLWFYSGDIGMFVWTKENNGYVENLITPGGPFVENMPPLFYSYLGSSRQKYLKK